MAIYIAMNICIAKVIAAWLAHSCLYMQLAIMHVHVIYYMVIPCMGISCDVMCLFNFGT